MIELWRLEPVEPDIKPLVDALNTVEGVEIIASCQGHKWVDGHRQWLPRAEPYVAFSGPTCFAAELEMYIRHDADSDEPILRWHPWRVSAYFDTQFKLIFALRGQFSGFWPHNRSRLRRDLMLLCQFVRRAAQMGNGYHPMNMSFTNIA